MTADDHFFIVGAQRSGTTYLYRMLEQHPDICMARPVRPEPKYFLRDLPVTADTRQHYVDNFFWHRQGERLLGEKSTSYIESEVAARRIAQHYPRAHVVFLLRDPVRRAISNYRFSLDNGLETLGLEAALDAEKSRLAQAQPTNQSVSPFAYVRRGLYIRYLDAWRAHFPADRMHTLVSENVLGSKQALRELFAQLGVKPDVAVDGLDHSVNDTGPALEVGKATQERLRKAFRQSNELLAERYGLDIGAWQ